MHATHPLFECFGCHETWRSDPRTGIEHCPFCGANEVLWYSADIVLQVDPTMLP